MSKSSTPTNVDEEGEGGEAGETATNLTYTEEELAEYKTLFSKFDRDGNDSIDPSELGDALRFLGCNPLDSEIDAMVAEADGKSNDNGKLEFLEFCEIIAKNRKTLEQEEEELRSAFRLFDKNGDGFIDKEELKKTIQSTGMWEAMTEEELEQMLNDADTNKNGTVEYNELVQAILAIER